LSKKGSSQSAHEDELKIVIEKNEESKIEDSQNNSGKKRKIVYLPFLLPGKIDKKEGEVDE
jgi:hypothetical protein